MDDKRKSTNPFEKKPQEPPRKALVPCSRCKSWETTVANGIFVCHNCGFEGG